jgi:D-3-phosphoglycerate dehydrogenase / 2-oxoglutarate reductase
LSADEEFRGGGGGTDEINGGGPPEIGGKFVSINPVPEHYSAQAPTASNLTQPEPEARPDTSAKALAEASRLSHTPRVSWRVLVTSAAMSKVGMASLQLMRDAGCEVVMAQKMGPLPARELEASLPGFDAILASVDQFTREVLLSPNAKKLKLISRWGVGYDSVDIPLATEQGIVVAYVPGLLNNAVADYAFSLLCSIARRVHSGHLLMTQGVWKQEWGHDIYGKTIGIIGCGRIGQAVAKRASGFDMRVLAFDPIPSAVAEKMGVKFVSLEELLRESDFVSLHMALTKETRGLISEPQLGLMKRTAYLINTARGPVIDEPALAKALKDGVIAGAALDVFAVEPLDANHIFRTTPNLLLSPHQSSWAHETGASVSRASAEAIVTAMQGGKPRWVVDPAVYSSPNLRSKISA